MGQLWECEKSIPIRPKQWQLLRYLAERPGTLVPKNELLDNVWGKNVAVQPQIVDQTLTGLRQRLGDKAKGSRFIETVSGALRFVADIEQEHRYSAKVFFNNGWDGFDPSQDADVLFVAALTVDPVYLFHASLHRELKTTAYYTEPGIGIEPEALLEPFGNEAWVSLCFGARPLGERQSSHDYEYYFSNYRPRVPEGVAVSVCDGNEQAMWDWTTKVPPEWLLSEPPYLQSNHVERITSVFNVWIGLHNAEIDRITQLLHRRSRHNRPS